MVSHGRQNSVVKEKIEKEDFGKCKIDNVLIQKIN
jgi:hypothetical protein